MKLGLTTLDDVRRHIIFARATWMLTTYDTDFKEIRERIKPINHTSRRMISYQADL